MDISDPFAPAYQSDNGLHVDLPEHWMSPFPPEEAPAPEPSTLFGSVEPQPEAATSVVGTGYPLGVGGQHSGDFDRAKQIAGRLAGDLKELQQSLDATEAERASWIADRNQMREQIRQLEEEAAHKRQFEEALTAGTGASISADDLKALQSITDALTQDPDRLTVLFNVVQQAGKLAAVVTVYSELRQLASV